MNAQTTTTTRGKIYIASMNLRGKWATKLDPESMSLNVTSAQGKLNQDRLAFSPMTEIPGGYKGYDRFESYWQSGKVFEGIPEDKVKAWWRAQTTAKRRYPPGKGKTVLHATFDGHSEPLDYVTAREKVYIKEYYDMIRDKERVLYYEQKLREGRSITIYDFDGPRTEDGDVLCLELDIDLLRSKIQYLPQPFGHGYVVGTRLLGLGPSDICRPL
jgi:hypothetical protein